MTSENELDPEISAISAVYLALKDLDLTAQARVLEYVSRKLGVKPMGSGATKSEERRDSAAVAGGDEGVQEREIDEEADEFEGISPVARRWMTRNSLEVREISKIFSLGIDEIDLVAKTVPGSAKKDRMRSVFLLKGAAAYLGTGAARFSHEQIKEACLHYDAFDSGNFATYYRSLGAEVSGNKDNGYTLTARGLMSATELVKEMAQVK